MTDGTTTWTYNYDANGMRTSRSNGTTTYEYIYNGSQLVQMTVGDDTLYFTPDTVTYNGTVYYYVTNLQGDITAIINSSGALAVLYTYDAWGNILTIDGTMADTLGVLNPIRYRSYVYDSESGLYYLQSRYYDPEMGRFLNADGYTSTDQGLVGNNMFAYCLNNPVSRADPTGEASIIPLPTLADYYHMHKAVQYDIAEQYGFAIEVYCVGPKGIGWLDIYDGVNNAFYEVKHNLAATGKHFTDQMEKYDAAHVSGWRFLEYDIAGNVTRGTQYLSGTTQYSYWDIRYWKAADGVIVYVWEVNDQRYSQYLASVGALVVTAYVCSTGSNAKRIGDGIQTKNASIY